MKSTDGFKQTEIGLLPLDWDIKSLQELGTIVRGGSPRPAGSPRYFGGSYIPWLTVAAITNIKESELYVTKTAGYLTEEGSKHSRGLTKNTMIISNSGATLGVAKLLGIKCCANDGIAALIDQKSGNKEFVCQYFNTLTKYLREDVATGNGQPNLNTDLIRNIQVPFPPEEEQAAIAKTLSDMDSLLNLLDSLISKKKDLRQACLEQLLSGKKRLLGFSDAWQQKTLGEVVTIQKGQLITSSTLKPGYVPVIAGGKKPAYFNKFSNRSGRTITISASGASAGYVALYEVPIFASDCSTISESSSYSLDFIYYQLLLNQKKIYKSQTGGAQPHIHPKDLKPIQISLPALEEQYAIVKILSEMSNELVLLEERRNKTYALKQSMMQDLLTGKRRLI